MSSGYQALRRGAAWLDLSARGRIVVRGRDRTRWLHNVTSNDIKRLQPGSGCYAFLLNPQGHIQSDLVVFCFADRFLLGTEPEMREPVMRHIRRYIIADQVDLEDVTSSTSALAVEGPGASAVMSALGAPVPGVDYAHVPWNDLTVAAASLTGQPGFRFLLPSPEIAPLVSRLEAAGALPATPEDARLVRIENGQPRYGEDIRETALPQETGRMHAVSFTKGCYIGQEIVERIRARGHVNRKLERLELDVAEPPAPGTRLSTPAGEAEITSAVYSPVAGKVVALAYVRPAVAQS
jgi:tRNA-modifying protein YgfZ